MLGARQDGVDPDGHLAGRDVGREIDGLGIGLIEDGEIDPGVVELVGGRRGRPLEREAAGSVGGGGLEIGGTLGKDYVLWLEVVELIVTFEGQFAVDLDGLWPSCGDTCGDEPVSDGVDEGSEGFGGLAESVSDIELGGSFWVSHFRSKGANVRHTAPRSANNSYDFTGEWAKNSLFVNSHFIRCV